MDCAGKKDGYYSNGCTPEFVFCSEGVATTMVALTSTHKEVLKERGCAVPEMPTNTGIQ